MPISSKERIKKAALSLFVQKGYYGASMRDISAEVGITKSSLYSHYSGKDDLFLAVFRDVADAHGKLFERLVDTSKDMGIEKALRFNFEEYIIFFYTNPEIQSFSNQSLFHIPNALRKEINPIYLSIEKPYRKRLAEIFKDGMDREVIKEGNPDRKVWSFKAIRDGVLGWLCAVSDLNEKFIQECWEDFWCGVSIDKKV